MQPINQSSNQPIELASVALIPSLLELWKCPWSPKVLCTFQDIVQVTGTRRKACTVKSKGQPKDSSKGLDLHSKSTFLQHVRRYNIAKTDSCEENAGSEKNPSFSTSTLTAQSGLRWRSPLQSAQLSVALSGIVNPPTKYQHFFNIYSISNNPAWRKPTVVKILKVTSTFLQVQHRLWSVK